ncbi:MAG: hypothetical protein MZV63_02960 [Marinilabiliales bacterium]|nr:hypothetical protein [Marinilabiliales bacterium]
MKIPARDRIFANGGIITMKEAMEYVMTLPVSTIIVGIDKIAELEENIKIARNFKPLTADEMLAIEGKDEASLQGSALLQEPVRVAAGVVGAGSRRVGNRHDS